jgi:hypothetical protein
MGFEYKIAFRVPDDAEVELLLDRLRENWPSDQFSVTLESDGFYFCDHTKSDQSCIAFRRLIDEALIYSEVVVREL